MINSCQFLTRVSPFRNAFPKRNLFFRGVDRQKNDSSSGFASIKNSTVRQNLQRPELRNIKDGGIGIGYFLLIIPVSTFCLGCWQIKRKKWKEGLLESVAQKTKIPAVPLPTEMSEIQSMEYRRVSVQGRFDHSQEQYLGPRSRLSEGDSTYGGKLLSTSANNSSGYLVITPFILSSTGERILVNRGWVPLQKKKASTRYEGQIVDEVQLEGIIRLTEPRPQFSPPNKLDVRVWFHRDVENMAAFADCTAIYLDACVESTVPGGPIGGQTRASFRNEHLSYIITWLSLSAATSIMWYKKYVAKVW